MQRHFDEDLKLIRNLILEMASLVDSQVTKALEALFTGNLDLAAKTAKTDQEINKYENLIDESCEKIIALHQPVANDLRLLISALKINNDLERMGDICTNICERVPKLYNHLDLLRESDISGMGDVIKKMIKESIDSYIYLDIPLAKNVIHSDDKVDKYDDEITNYYIGEMQQRSEIIVPAASILTILKNMERLADHATNIAEDVVFLKEGIIIKHRKDLL